MYLQVKKAGLSARRSVSRGGASASGGRSQNSPSSALARLQENLTVAPHKISRAAEAAAVVVVVVVPPVSSAR